MNLHEMPVNKTAKKMERRTQRNNFFSPNGYNQGFGNTGFALNSVSGFQIVLYAVIAYFFISGKVESFNNLHFAIRAFISLLCAIAFFKFLITRFIGNLVCFTYGTMFILSHTVFKYYEGFTFTTMQIVGIALFFSVFSLELAIQSKWQI